MADYIDREKAIERLVELEQESKHNSVLWPDHVEECREALRGIPAADVRPVVRGYWHGEGDGFADGELVCDMWQCICCGEWFDEWNDKPTWNFCPNCGADMRGEQDV